MKTLFALAVLALQGDLEKKIDELVGRLDDDRIDAREAAVQALVELGPAAVPLLKNRIEKLDLESKGRVEDAVRSIEAREAMSQSLPPLRRVTLALKDRPVREALVEIRKQTGLPFDFTEASVDAAISVALKDATPLEALDEVCRLGGQLSYAVSGQDDYNRLTGERIPREPRIRFSNGDAREYPAFYVRHYRLRVTQISLTRTNTFAKAGQKQSSAYLTLDAVWPPDVKPDGVTEFRITELKDDQGRSLLMQEGAAAGRMPRQFGRVRRTRGYDSTVNETVPFKYPEADARKIAVLKGEVSLRFPKETRMIVFDKLAESRGKTVDVGGAKVTLKDYQDKGTSHLIELQVTGRIGGAGGTGSWDALPFSYEDVEITTESGARLESGSMSGSGDGKSYTLKLDRRATKPEPVKEVRIPCVLSHFQDDFKFELKDIPLPK